MSDKKRVELAEEALDMVSGGIDFSNGRATNMETGESYPLKVDALTAFMYITSFGSSIGEAERMEKLRSMNYI